MRAFRNHRRSAFTLVELLTVIVIIGILASLISAAAIYARARAREAAIHTEMRQIEAALITYKSEYGEFPPDFWGLDGSAGVNAQNKAVEDLRRHLRKRWPKFAPGADPVAAFQTALNTVNIDPGQFNPATALVFWLGGLPAEAPQPGVSYQPAGFHADPANPFQYGQPRQEPLYDFDPDKIYVVRVDPNNPSSQIINLYYYPVGEPNSSSPLVYFRAGRDKTTGRYEYGMVDGGAFIPASFTYAPTNVAVPYLKGPANGSPSNPAVQRQWREPEKFQIIHCGLDGVFSTPIPPSNPPAAFRFTVSAEGFSDGDYDNVTNFVAKLEDEVE